MRCFGITKSFKRCKKPCRAVYCHSHKLQWWAIVLIIGTIAGLYQDVIAPLFVKKKNANTELINLIKLRKQDIDSNYTDVLYSLSDIKSDSNVSNHEKTYIDNLVPKIKLEKSQYDTLIEKHINALLAEQPILSHELHTSIHNKGDQFKNRLISNDTFKKLEIKFVKLKIKMEKLFRLTEQLYNNILPLPKDSATILELTRLRDSLEFRIRNDTLSSDSIK
jgi:hypothetical protein